MPYKILLADDSLTIQKVVELTFSDPETSLMSVGSGDRAVQAFDEFHPDIVLADVVMPKLSGYEVCEAVKARPGGQFVPVVLLTGTFEPFDRARAERVGSDAIVTKPFDSHALASLVQDLVRKAEARRAEAAATPPPARAATPEPARVPAFEEEPLAPTAPFLDFSLDEQAAPSVHAEAPPPEAPSFDIGEPGLHAAHHASSVPLAASAAVPTEPEVAPFDVEQEAPRAPVEVDSYQTMAFQIPDLAVAEVPAPPADIETTVRLSLDEPGAQPRRSRDLAPEPEAPLELAADVPTGEAEEVPIDFLDEPAAPPTAGVAAPVAAAEPFEESPIPFGEPSSPPQPSAGGELEAFEQEGIPRVEEPVAAETVKPLASFAPAAPIVPAEPEPFAAAPFAEEAAPEPFPAAETEAGEPIEAEAAPDALPVEDVAEAPLAGTTAGGPADEATAPIERVETPLPPPQPEPPEEAPLLAEEGSLAAEMERVVEVPPPSGEETAPWDADSEPPVLQPPPPPPHLLAGDESVFADDEPIPRDIESDIEAFERSGKVLRRPEIWERHAALIGEEPPADIDLRASVPGAEELEPGEPDARAGAEEPLGGPSELEALAAQASLTDLSALIPPVSGELVREPVPAVAPPAVTAGPAALSEADVDRIARKVVELIGSDVVREIAWEVVPELAVRLVRQRIAEVERGS